MILQTPLETSSHDGVYGIEIHPKPTMSCIPKKSWWRRLWCRHYYKYLYSEDLMFFQDSVGRAHHYGCFGCGETTILESENRDTPPQSLFK